MNITLDLNNNQLAKFGITDLQNTSKNSQNQKMIWLKGDDRYV